MGVAMNGRKYEVCAHCKGYINTEVTSYEVIVLHSGEEVYAHYAHCGRWFREANNGEIKSWHRGDGKHE